MSVDLSGVFESLTPLAVFAAFVWLLIFPALAWGKTAIPAADLGRLLARTAKLSLAVGFPFMLALLVLFGRMGPDRPPFGQLLARGAVVALGFLPLYGALIATSVFQARHRADRAAGMARPFPVRLLSGLAILIANAFACVVMLFTLFAVTGVYRGWN